jgi:hypothetical protein
LNGAVTGLADLFATHCATSFARQLALADVIGERPWGLGLKEGQIAFGNDLRFGVQILGTRSDATDSWMWAWANDASNLPPPLVEASRKVRAYGEQHAIPELTSRTFPLDAISDHGLTMACRGLLDAACYYRAPYEGGAAFVLLDGVPASVTAPVRPERAVTVLMQVLENFDVDHARMARAFLTQQGYTLREGDGRWEATDAHGSTLVLAFDALGRLTKLEGSLKPAAAKAKPWWKLW